MRQSTALTSRETPEQRTHIGRHIALYAVAAVVGSWMLWSLAQDLWLSHQLSASATTLRQRNSALQVANDGYRQDIAAVSSGAAAEEEARMNGYARGDEKLYLISTPPPPKEGAESQSEPPADAHDGGLLAAAWRWLTSVGRR